MRTSWTISRYIIGTAVPYFLAAWLLLSVILFVQQASRFTDIFFNANIPSSLIWQLAFALVPNVVAFTCPMAALVGIVIGLSKMQGDSELVVIRTSGVDGIRIAVPIIFFGLVLSIFTFVINLYGVPFAATVVRSVAIRSAIQKLESPIEPGVFNTELAGYTIYVRDVGVSDGRWKNIFVHTADPQTGQVRLITSRQGRIDTTDQRSELVLEDAVSTTLSTSGTNKFVSETIGEVRVAIKTQRSELLERLSRTDRSPEELGIAELAKYARTKEGKERLEAEIIRLRRILLSITPLIFSVLGLALVLRFNRGSRGIGLFISLVCLITYYLLGFGGEQLARTGNINVLVGAFIPVLASLGAIIWISYSGKSRVLRSLGKRFNAVREALPLDRKAVRTTSIFRRVSYGLRDLDLLASIARYFLTVLAFLLAIFMVFTAFELWRFAGSMEGGVLLLLKYLLHLTPFAYLQLAPSAAMVAILATYVIKSRRNEVVTWTAAGQSIYRLIVPCFVLMLVLGLANFGIQEIVAVRANVIQDIYRMQLRNRSTKPPEQRRYWVSDEHHIVSHMDNTRASDNETDGSGSYSAQNVWIFEFGGKGDLQASYRSQFARWEEGVIELFGEVNVMRTSSGGIVTAVLETASLPAPNDPFKAARKKPSQMTIPEIREQIEVTESDVERRVFAIAYEKKWSTMVFPFVIALFTVPFALSLDRKGKAVTVGYAVGLWLVFMAATSALEQLGVMGMLPAVAAVWLPLLAFGMLGLFFLTRVRT